MKRHFCKIMMFLAAASLAAAGCDDFDRTGVDSAIYVNHQSISLFEGEQMQLTASPADGDAFEWRSDDEEVAIVADGLVTAVGEGNTDIVASRDGATFRVEVTVLVKVPLTDVKLSSSDLELTIGATGEVAVEMVPVDANDVPLSDFDWWSDDESVARVSLAGEVTGVAEGSTTVHYRKGSFVKDINVYVSSTLPFNGPHILSGEAPLELWFRDFDKGGANVAYYDTTSGNSAGGTYRKDNGDNNSGDVDVESGGNIGYTATGEWLLYTVEVEDAGVYSVEINASGSGGTFYLELDGEKLTEDLSIAATSGWSDYQKGDPFEITLPEGKHKLKFFMSNASYNLMTMTFTFVK